MKVGFGALVGYVPDQVVPKERFDYLEPALQKLPPPLREKFSVVPDEVRRDKGEPSDRVARMSTLVASQALGRAGLEPRDIDCVIGAPVSLYGELAIAPDTPLLNIGNCCASFLEGCHTAWGLVESGECRRVLVVAAAALAAGPYGGPTDPTDPVAPVFGDGAAAVIVSRHNLKCEFLSYYCETNGACYRSARGEVRPPANPELAQAAQVSAEPAVYFTMDDLSHIEAATRRGYLTRTLGRALGKANLPLGAVDVVICHHLGDCEEAWVRDLLEAGLGADVFKNLRLKLGNTGHTDLPIDLARFVEEGHVKRGSVVALWVPGSGISLSCLVLRWLA